MNGDMCHTRPDHASQGDRTRFPFSIDLLDTATPFGNSAKSPPGIARGTQLHPPELGGRKPASDSRFRVSERKTPDSRLPPPLFGAKLGGSRERILSAGRSFRPFRQFA